MILLATAQWSVEFENVPQFKRAMRGGIVSKYIPFSLDPGRPIGSTGRVGRNLSWWQHHHPDWVLYRCDRKTPATYWGNKIPLDLTNPEVRQWQLNGPPAENPESVAAIVAAGFDAVSLDVYGTGNYGITPNNSRRVLCLDTKCGGSHK